MKLSLLQHQSSKIRGSTSFRASAPIEHLAENAFKSPGAFFWLVLHALCCLISLVWGFRFSRLLSPVLRSTTEIGDPSSPSRPRTGRRAAYSSAATRSASGRGRNRTRRRSWRGNPSSRRCRSSRAAGARSTDPKP